MLRIARLLSLSICVAVLGAGAPPPGPRGTTEPVGPSEGNRIVHGGRLGEGQHRIHLGDGPLVGDIEGMPDGVVMLDSDNSIIWSNGRLGEWFDREQIVGATGRGNEQG